MSTKITKTQLENLIKEETEKVLSEAAASFASSGMNAAEVAQWGYDNWKTFGSEMRKLQEELTSFEFAGKIMSKHMKERIEVIAWRDTNIDNPDLADLQKSWKTCVTKLFPSQVFARSLLMSCVKDFKSRSPQSDAAEFVRGNGTPLTAFMTGFEKAAEILDNRFDDLDRFDGAVGRGSVIGYTKAANELMAEALKKIRPIFWKWVSGTLGGTPTPTPAPAPSKRDCAMAKKLIAQIQKLDSPSIPTDIGKLPEYIASIEKRVWQSFQQIASAPTSLEEGFLEDIKAKAGSAMNSVKKFVAEIPYAGMDSKSKAIAYVAYAYNCPDAAGGLIKPVKPPKKSGGTCGKFNKFAAQVTGQKDVKQAVKAIQEILVNLGYSVKRGETDSGFGPGKGMIPSTKLKSAGIDGRCGRGTMDAVKRFQGANKLSVDGIVGPNTYKVLVSVAKTGGNKKAAAAPAGASKADTLGIIKAYSFVYNTLRGRIVNSLQSKKTEGANGIATKLIDAVLPGLQTAGGNRYKLKNKTYSIDSPDFGSDLMAGLSALKSSASNVEAATGIKSSEIIRIVDKASNTYMKSALEESKSYNLDFNKWSKLWK